MKLKTIYRQYILIAVLPLVGLSIYQPLPNMVKGYIIGMLLALAQLTNSVYKGNSIANTYGKTNSKSVIVTGSMFLPLIIIAIALFLTFKFLGKGALYTCATALLLQKPALLLVLNKLNRKGGVN